MNVRKLAHLCVGYGAATLLTHIVILSGVVVARVVRGDPRVPRRGIRNFRTIDERLWAGSQPTAAAYRALAAEGVTTVVDLCVGTAADPAADDPAELARLGVAHVAIPIRDGHAPRSGDISAFVHAVDAAPGIAYVHCGAGVGRTASLQMAYLAAAGRPHGVLAQLAVGPPSIEQIGFVASLRGGGGRVPRHLVLLSRVVDAPRQALGGVRRLVRWRGVSDGSPSGEPGTPEGSR